MATWTIDPTHSEVQFRVRHLVISNVTGSFQKFDGKVEADKEDFSDAKISFSADIDSITTHNEQRDGHLKSADFFDAAQFPKLSFESVSFEKSGEGTYAMTGNLTIKGHTQPATLEVTHGGVADDFYGNTKAGFEISGKISRQQYGLTWNAVTEAGGTVVSDEVKLIMEVQVVKQ